MDDKEKLKKIVKNHVDKKIKEVFEEEGFCPGGAYFTSSPGTVGGVYGPFQTLNNTVGIGDPVPAGIDSAGSGDRFDNKVVKKISKKKK